MFHNYNKLPFDKYTFEIHDLDISIINGLRRTILTDIKTVGFACDDDSTINIIENTGPLHNEIMSHRIALIPINLTEEEIDNYEDNDYEFTLNIKNNTNTTKNIDTSMIIGKYKGKELSKDELKRIFPANEITKHNILITKLRSDEILHFVATTTKRSSRNHAGFSVVSLCNFFYIEDPSKSSKTTNILDKERSYYINKYGDATRVQFELEPIINISPSYLMTKAIDIMIKKLNNIIEQLSLDEHSEILIEKYEGLNNTYEFSIKNEDDTIGNIIQSLLFNKYIREKKVYMDDIICSYIGYICPHPLQQLLKIRITLENQENKLLFIQFLINNCADIVEQLNYIKTEWVNFIKK